MLDDGAVFLFGQVVLNVFLGDVKVYFTAHRCNSNPQSVVAYEWKDFLVGDGIVVSKNQEFFTVLHELRDIFAEERERGICDNNVGLFEEFDAFRRAEVAIAFEIVDSYLRRVGDTVAISIAEVFQPIARSQS